MDPTIGHNNDRVKTVEPAQRSADLAAARRHGTEQALQSAEASKVRKADQREMVRGILERAVGANTKLSISRADNIDTFVYRAIDRDSGEVIREWPPAQFANFLAENGVAKDAAADALAGLVLDQQA